MPSDSGTAPCCPESGSETLRAFGQLISATRVVTATAHQAALLAAAERFMQHNLAGRALAQAGNLPGGTPRAKRPAVNSVENSKLDLSKRIANAHPASLRSGLRSPDSAPGPAAPVTSPLSKQPATNRENLDRLTQVVSG